MTSSVLSVTSNQNDDKNTNNSSCQSPQSSKSSVQSTHPSKRSISKCSKCLKNESNRPTRWIDCKKCSNPYHWSCVARNVLDPIEIVENWYCDQCLKSDSSLKCTYKNPPRKSNRSNKNSRINYADSNTDDPLNDPDRFINLANSKSNIFDASDSKQIGAHKPFRRVRGNELSLDWLLKDENAMMEPIIIDDPDCLNSLGMRMPSSDLSIREISNIVGPKTPVEVMDVASQSELSRWTLDDWATYFEKPDRDRIRNVISLEVSETELGKLIELPRIVREMDWVQTIWPDDLKLHRSRTYPKVQKYCLMSVARCWTDWHVDFAGSSVFYHILRGSKVFYFIRPTVANLSKYEKWSGNSQMQESTWLGDQVNMVYKVTLQAGNTMIIPTGWIHAVYTPTDSLVFGGNYLHSLNIPIQLRIHQIENNTKVPKKFRFPFFSSSLWLVANHYLNRLREKNSKDEDKDLKAENTQEPQNLDNVGEIPNRVLTGLLALAEFLIDSSIQPSSRPLSFSEAQAIIKHNLTRDQQLSRQLQPIAAELKRLVKLSLGQTDDGVQVKEEQEEAEGSIKESNQKAIKNERNSKISQSPSTAPLKGSQTNKRKVSKAERSTQEEENRNQTMKSGSQDEKDNDEIRSNGKQQKNGNKKLKLSNKTENVNQKTTTNIKNNNNKSNGDSNGSNDVPNTSKRDLGEIVFRLNEPPSTKVEIQKRKVPKYEDLNPPSKEKERVLIKGEDSDEKVKKDEEIEAKDEGDFVEGVEVRTTRAQNKVVRKYLDGDGRTVYETRTVYTVIEKAIYPKQ